MAHDSMAQAEPSVALVVERDDAVRHLASAVLEETDLSVISCCSAEAALSVLERDDVSVAMLFADADLAGDMAGGMDGVALARAVEARWPSVRLVVTSDHGRDSALPKQAVHMAKPWRALDVLVQAEHATLEARAA